MSDPVISNMEKTHWIIFCYVEKSFQIDMLLDQLFRETKNTFFFSKYNSSLHPFLENICSDKICGLLGPRQAEKNPILNRFSSALPPPRPPLYFFLYKTMLPLPNHAPCSFI